MAVRYVLGVDLGTTAVKVGLFDDKGHVVATDTQEHVLITPSANIVEQTSEAYWNAFSLGLKNTIQKAGICASDIVSLSVSAQGETMVFLDEQMQPMSNFIVWMDARALDEAETINSWFSAEEQLAKTGQGPICSIYPASKVLWVKRNQPEIFAKAKKIVLLEDYFFYKMCGRLSGEGSLWCTSYMWDINSKKWWPEMLEKLDVREEQLPEIVEPGTKLGTILPDIAEELGLSKDLTLVMGALDQACGAIGVGNVKPGVFSECTGGALVVATLTEDIVFDAGGELPCFYGALPGLYMLHAGAKGGIIFRWLRDTLCSEEMTQAKEKHLNAYDLMGEQAAKVEAGSGGLVVLPYWGGAGAPDTDQYARGTIYGLGLEHTKAHIIRAFMEATAMNIRRMVEYSERVTGKPVTEIRSLGGGSLSPVWCQIKADTLGRPVVTMKNTQDAACLGAAVLAGVGVGLWPSASALTDSVVEIEHVYEPNPANKEAYDRLAERYDELVKCLKGHTKVLGSK